MGLFDLFRKKDAASGLERDIARLKKLSESKLSQDLDRPAAIDQLAAMGTPEAATVLLARFNWSLDPSIRDQEEKQVALSGVIRAGRGALGPIRAHLRKAEGATWPLKALRQILTAEELESEIIELLSLFDTDYSRNTEPKLQLIQALEEFSSEAVRQAVEPFLDDAAEAIRFAAVTTLFASGQEGSGPALVKALVKDESLRIRNKIAEGYAEKAWTLGPELQSQLSAKLPAGFSLIAGRVQGRAQR